MARRRHRRSRLVQMLAWRRQRFAAHGFEWIPPGQWRPPGFTPIDIYTYTCTHTYVGLLAYTCTHTYVYIHCFNTPYHFYCCSTVKRQVSKMLGWLKTQTKDQEEAQRRTSALAVYNKLQPHQKAQFLNKFVQNRKVQMA